MSSGGGIEKLLPILAAGGMGVSALLMRHKSKGAAPLLPSSSALDGNIPQLITPSYQPDPPPYVIPDGGGEVQNQVPQLVGIQNVLDKYGPVTKIYGRRLVYPKLCAEFVTQPRGNETVGLGLFIVNQGPCTIEDLKIGDKLASSFSAADFTYEFLPGDNPDSEQVTLFSTDFKTSQFAADLVYDTLVTKAAPQQAVRLAVDVSFPLGLYKKDSAGNREAETITFDVEYSVAGSGTWDKVPDPNALEADPSITVTDNSLQIVKKHLEWSVVKGSYLVRIKRLTAQTNNNTTIVNASQWSLLRATGDTPMIKPWRDTDGNIIPMSYLAVVFRQSETFNGTIQQINCIVNAKQPVWNGAIWTAPQVTRSPAWGMVEMLTGPAAPSPMQKTELDPAFFMEWDQFCIDRGFNFDQIYDAETTISQLLDECAESGRGSVHVRDGKHCVIFDKPQTAIVQHFTPRNTIKDSFQGHGTSPDQPHGVKVRWINPDADWQQDERIVYQDGYSADGTEGTAVATRFERMNAAGCTTADQAFRHGRYRLKVAALRRAQYKIGADWGHLACDRGDLVRLTNDVGLLGFGWGKILEVLLDGSGNLTGLVLDTTQEMVDGYTYGVRVRTDIGSGEENSFEAEVNTVAGFSSTLIFATPVAPDASPLPEAGDQIMFGLRNQESIPCIVESIEYHQDFLATLSLIDYVEALYDVETEPTPAWTTNITVKPKYQVTVIPPVVLNVRSDESVLQKAADGTLITRVLMTMQAPASSVANFELQYKIWDAQTWIPIALVPVAAGEISVSNLEDGVLYDFRIRNRTAGNFVSAWTPVQHLVIGKTTPPPALQTLSRNQNLLLWTYPDPPLDLAGFRIKFNRGADRNWQSGKIVADLVKSTSWVMTALPSGALTVMVAAVDTAGNEGAFAILSKDFGDPPLANVLDIHSEAPDFLGTITNGSIAFDVLVADDDGGLFWTGPDDSLFYGGNDSDLFWDDSFQELTYEFTYIPERGVCGEDGFNLSLLTDIQGAGYTIEYRTGGDSLFYDGDDGDSFWGTDDDELFWGADEDFSLWPAQIEGTLQQYDFKVTCPASGLIQGKIFQLDIVVDVPDLVEYINDFVFEPGVTENLVLSNTYREIKNIQLTLQYDPADYPDADKVFYLNKEVTGPLIRVSDSGGTPTAGIVDAIVKGFGGLR